MKKSFITLVGIIAAGMCLAIAPEELAKRQARSIHLAYGPCAETVASAMGSVVVTESQTNSYFMIIGWGCGYSGIQDLGDRGKIFIFSVWDPGDPFDFNIRPDQVAEAQRAKVLFADQGVNVARFGGEGTGARTMTEIGWKVGDKVTCRIDSAPDGDTRMAYTCSIKVNDGEWRKLATISTLKGHTNFKGIEGIYSFVEDFWRNYYSATLSRRAEFFDIRTKGKDDAEWTVATKAQFTADGTPSNAIDAGKLPNGRFFLKTGGNTTNVTTRLWSTIL